MKPSRTITLSLLLSGGVLLASHAPAQTITEWNFNNYTPSTKTTLDVVTSPTPTTGSGTATSLGMNNNYNSSLGQPASVDTSDMTNGTPQSSDPVTPITANNEWRIRGGTGTTSPGGSTSASNGWSSFAPIASQGAQFLTSTLGYTGVQVSFDWSPTGSGEQNLQVMYTLNGSTYVNVPAALFTLPSTVTSMTNATNTNIVVGGYIQTTNSASFNNGIKVNLSSIAGASNNPNFGIELVNAATGAADTDTTGAALNNTSGNWRFDEVTISSIPEPSAYAALLSGAAVLGWMVRRTRSARA